MMNMKTHQNNNKNQKRILKTRTELKDIQD